MNRALRAATVGVLLLTPVVLSSCSSGQINQTSTQNRDKAGAGATVGPLVLRSVKLAFPTGGSYAAGSDAELGMAIVNTSEQPDVLVGISGDDFTGVRVSGTGTSPQSSNSASSSLSSVPGSPVGTVPPFGIPSAGGSSTPAAGATTAGGTAASSSAVPTTPAGASTAATGIAGATGTPTATTSVAAPPAGGTAVALPIPPDSSLFLGENVPHVFLTGLTRSLTPAQNVRITLTFQRAGAVTVLAMVSGPTSYVPNSSSYDFEQPTEANIPGNEGGGGGIAEETGSNG